MFWVGQRVVCVDDRANRHSGINPPIKRGHIYTVSHIGKGFEGIGLDLIEAPIPVCEHKLYHSRRFRPILKRKTDISIFIKMLTPNTRTKETTSV